MQNYQPGILSRAIKLYQQTASPQEEWDGFMDYLSHPNSENSAVRNSALASLMNALVSLDEAAFDQASMRRNKPDIERLRAFYNNEMDQIFSEPMVIDASHRAALQKLHEKLHARADASNLANPYTKSLIALDRFNNYLALKLAESDPESVAVETREAKRRGDARELLQRQAALNAAVDNFLADPENSKFQEKLAKELAWFQELILKQERARRRETVGVVNNMAAAEDRISALDYAFTTMGMNKRNFTPFHYYHLEQLLERFLAKSTENAGDFVNQQASAINAFKAYIYQQPGMRKAVFNDELKVAIADFLSAPNNLVCQTQLIEKLGEIKLDVSEEELPANLKHLFGQLQIDLTALTQHQAQILNSLTQHLIREAREDINDPITQQAYVMISFAEYISEQLEIKEKKAIKWQVVAKYALGALFVVATLASLATGFAAVLPLVAASLHMGLVLAPPVALALASVMAFLTPVGIFLAAVAMRAAKTSRSLFAAAKELSRLVRGISKNDEILRAYGLQVPSDMGLKGSLNNAQDEARFSPSSGNLTHSPLHTPSSASLSPFANGGEGEAERDGPVLRH